MTQLANPPATENKPAWSSQGVLRVLERISEARSIPIGQIGEVVGFSSNDIERVRDGQLHFTGQQIGQLAKELGTTSSFLTILGDHYAGLTPVEMSVDARHVNGVMISEIEQLLGIAVRAPQEALGNLENTIGRILANGKGRDKSSASRGKA